MDQNGLFIAPFSSSDTGQNVDLVAQLKISPDGQKVACTYFAMDSFYVSTYRFNPYTSGAVSNPSLLGTVGNPFSFYGVEFSPNGRFIYVSGEFQGAGRLLQFDLEAGDLAAVKSSQVQLAALPDKYIRFLQLAPNGKIYGAPGIENSVLVINPTDNSIYTIPSPYTGSLKWSGFNLGIDGRLYATPLSNNPYYLSLNPNDDSVSLILAPTTGSQRWFGGSLAPSGKIYHSPSNDDSVLEFNSETLGSTLYTQGITGTDKWMPLKLGPNGRMFATPSNADYVLIINSNAKGKYCDSILYSSYMN